MKKLIFLTSFLFIFFLTNFQIQAAPGSPYKCKFDSTTQSCIPCIPDPNSPDDPNVCQAATNICSPDIDFCQNEANCPQTGVSRLYVCKRANGTQPCFQLGGICTPEISDGTTSCLQTEPSGTCLTGNICCTSLVSTSPTPAPTRPPGGPVACGVNIDPANPGAFPAPSSVAGSKWVRIEFKDCTPDIEGQDNEGFESSLEAYRAAIESYNSVGVGVVLILDYASYPLASQNIDKFATRAGKIASAYSGLNIVYEIWNEPDLPGFFYLGEAKYAQVLNATVPKIKSQGGKVITGGLGNGEPEWIGRVRSLASGVWGQIDGIGIHPYGATPNPGSQDCDLGGSFGSQLPDYLNRAYSAGGNKPLWATEFGWPTPNQANQARYNTCFYEAAARSGKVAASIVYTWSDAQGTNWGLVSASNNPKTAHGAYFYSCGTTPPPVAGNQAAIALSGGSCFNQSIPPDSERLKRPCLNQNQPSDQPLRPYPYNPCDPFIPERNTMSFQCGNGLNVNGTFDFENVRRSELGSLPPLDPNNEIDIRTKNPYKNSGDLYRCTDEPNKVCAVQRVPFDIKIELKSATLPVIGSTETVIEDDAVKANAFLSWYLQGGDWNPDGQVSVPNPNDPFRPYLTFSGPLRKILAQSSQREIRQVITSSGADIHNYLLRPVPGGGRIRGVDPLSELFSKVPFSSMEDIVGETIVTAISKPEAQPTGVQTPTDQNSINAIRLYITRTNVDGKWASDGRLYMPHLRETYGLSYLLQNYALPYNKTGDEDILSNPRVVPIDPVSPTDWQQRLIVGTPDKNAHQGETDQTIAQFTKDIDGDYGETWTRNTEIIDNPKTSSINIVKSSGSGLNPSLATSLDNGNIDTGRAPAPKVVFQNNRYVSVPDPAPSSFTGLCSISDAVYTPGDSMVDKNGWSINARLTYTQVFKYDALPDPGCPAGCLYASGLCVGSSSANCGTGYTCAVAETQSQCYSNCITNGGTPSECTGSCQGAGIYGSCQPEEISLPTSARVAVMTKTPLVREIYESLVSGFQSVLRRFLPGRTPELASSNNCYTGEYINGEYKRVEQDFDQSCIRSVSTLVSYSANSTETSPNHPSVADGVSPTTPSNAAEIYFPYLGSLSDYFLGCGSENLNLQKLLRPQGMSSACISPGVNKGSAQACLPGTKTAPVPTASCGLRPGISLASQIGTDIELGPDSRSTDTSRRDIRLFNGRQLTIAENQTIGLIDIDGPTDNVAPYLPSMGISAQDISSVYTLTGEFACITPVNLIGIRTSSGQEIRLPQAGYNPYGGSNGQATIVYADCDEITLVYAKFDGIQFQNGSSGPYTLHLKGLQVDQNIIDAYQLTRQNFVGTRELPFLNAGQRFGVGSGGEMIVGIRDTGTLMDPRTRKDWWQ